MVGGCLLPACQFQSTHRFQRPRTKSRLHFPYLTGSSLPSPSPSLPEAGASPQHRVPPFARPPGLRGCLCLCLYTQRRSVFREGSPQPPLVLTACLLGENWGLARAVLHIAAIWQNVWEGPIVKIVKKEGGERGCECDTSKFLLQLTLDSTALGAANFHFLHACTVHVHC